jgi:hypothetical protein
MLCTFIPIVYSVPKSNIHSLLISGHNHNQKSPVSYCTVLHLSLSSLLKFIVVPSCGVQLNAHPYFIPTRHSRNAHTHVPPCLSLFPRIRTFSACPYLLGTLVPESPFPSFLLGSHHYARSLFLCTIILPTFPSLCLNSSHPTPSYYPFLSKPTRNTTTSPSRYRPTQAHTFPVFNSDIDFFASPNLRNWFSVSPILRPSNRSSARHVQFILVQCAIETDVHSHLGSPDQGTIVLSLTSKLSRRDLTY